MHSSCLLTWLAKIFENSCFPLSLCSVTRNHKNNFPSETLTLLERQNLFPLTWKTWPLGKINWAKYLCFAVLRWFEQKRYLLLLNSDRSWALFFLFLLLERWTKENNKLWWYLLCDERGTATHVLLKTHYWMVRIV